MAGRRQIEAGKAVVTLSLRDRLTTALNRTLGRVKQFGRELTTAGRGLLGVGAALGAPIVAAARNFAKVGDTLDKMSQRTGVSTNALSELGFAAEQSGSDLETLEKGVRSMQRNVTDLGRGLSTQVSAFGRLGLAYADLENLSPEQQFEVVADRISLLQNETIRAATAMQVFGRSGQQLLPLLNSGAQGIEALRRQARDLGLSIDPDSAKAAAELTDQVNILARVLKVTLFSAGQAVSPLFIDLTRRAQGGAQSFKSFVQSNDRLVIGLTKLAGVVGGLGAAIVGLGVLVTSLTTLASLANPVTLGIAGISAAIVGLTASFNGGRIAGIDFGKQILQLANDLGILENASLKLEGAEKAVARAAQEVARAEADLAGAKPAKERLRANEQLIAAIENQIEARKRLKLAEADSANVDRTELIAKSRALQSARSAVELSKLQSEDGAPSKEALDRLLDAEQQLRQLRERIDAGLNDPVQRALQDRLDSASASAQRFGEEVAAAALANNGSIQSLRQRIIDLNSEAADLEAQLKSVGEGAGIDSDAVQTLADRLESVRVEAKVAVGELAALKQQASDALAPTNEPQLFGRIIGRFREAFDLQAENAKQAVQVDFRLKLFGADEAKRSLLIIQNEADQLRNDLRSLGRLTPEIDADIANRTNRALEQALEVKAGPEAFAFGRNAVVDSRSIQSLQGGVVDYQQRTAKATEAVEKEIRRLAESGVLRYGG